MTYFLNLSLQRTQKKSRVTEFFVSSPMPKPQTAIFLLARLLLPTLVWAWHGKVISIADGDTITVLTDDRQQVRIRLYGIDAPEGGQAYGKKATQYVKRLLADRPVIFIAWFLPSICMV